MYTRHNTTPATTDEEQELIIQAHRPRSRIRWPVTWSKWPHSSPTLEAPQLLWDPGQEVLKWMEMMESGTGVEDPGASGGAPHVGNDRAHKQTIHR